MGLRQPKVGVMSPQTDVIIIGAGSAGLSAAKELTKQGISFVVVEASHRIGGRAYSEEIAPDVWFDLGCAYMVAGPDAKNQIDESNPFIDFAKNQGAVIEEYLYDAHCIHNGRPLDNNEMKAQEEYYKECEEAIRSSVEGGDDCAISEIIDLENPYATPYIDMMAVTAPKDLDEASAADFFNKVEEYVDYTALCGYGNLVAQWGGDVKVSLNTKVESVDWSGKDVLVRTVKGSIRARCLLSTVSNGVLAAQHIHFEPRLPDWKMDAIQGLPMGAENKIGVHFTKDVFGPGASGYYQSWSSEAQGAYIDVNLMSTNVVSVFMGGRFSIWMEKQQIYLVMIFGNRLVAPLLRPGSQTLGHWVPMPVRYPVNFTNVNHYRLPLITNCFLPARQLLVLMVLAMVLIGEIAATHMRS